MDDSQDFIRLFNENHMVFKGGAVYPVCSGCHLPLLDRIIMKVQDQLWHSYCLRCSDCNNELREKCYSKDRMHFCTEHFFRRYGTRCSACGDGILPLESVRRARNLVYHLKCFSCLLCRRILETGDHFYLMEDHTVLCQADYLAAAMSDREGSSKRPRTTISPTQLEALKLAYQRTNKPSRHVRERLAAETGLDMRVVQVWFQNRRAKEKRHKRETKNACWEKVYVSNHEQDMKPANLNCIIGQMTCQGLMETDSTHWPFSPADLRFAVFHQILYYNNAAE